jgi:hypothetical protein
MKVKEQIRNERDWDLSLLRYEIEQLRREREHLHSKQNERPLTSFEQTRAEAIAEEMSSLIRTVISFNREVSPAA